jgi:hypothetical protein
MSKHATDTASTTKKFLATGGLAFSLAGFGLFAGVGTAVADGTEACWGDGIHLPAGAFDAASSAGTSGATMPNPAEAGCEDSSVTGSYPAQASYGPHGSTSSSWPGGPTFTGYAPMHG